MPRRAWLIALFGLVLVAAGWLVLFRPWLERESTLPTTTPGLLPLISQANIGLAPGSTACVAPVRLDPTMGRALVVVRDPRPTQRVLFVASGPGYESAATVRARGVGGDEQLVAALRPPAGEIDGRLCVSNGGRNDLTLLGTNEARSLTISRTTVDGRPALADTRAVLLMLEPDDRSPLSSFDELARHLSAFTGGSMPVWLVWPLGLLLVFGVPLLTFAALAVALRR